MDSNHPTTADFASEQSNTLEKKVELLELRLKAAQRDILYMSGRILALEKAMRTKVKIRT